MQYSVEDPVHCTRLTGLSNNAIKILPHFRNRASIWVVEDGHPAIRQLLTSTRIRHHQRVYE